MALCDSICYHVTNIVTSVAALVALGWSAWQQLHINKLKNQAPPGAKTP